MAVRLYLSHLARNVNKNILRNSNVFVSHARGLQTSHPLFDTISLKMPSLSPTMEQGTIVQWHKKEGDTVVAGDIVCDIQTDKAVIGFEVDEDGILAKILKPDNSADIKIGTLIGVMVEEGDDWQNVEIPVTTDSQASETTTPDPTTPPLIASVGQSYGPAVRTILDQYNINIADVHGTGPHDRVLKGDLLGYIKERGLQPVKPAAISPPPAVIAPAVIAEPAVRIQTVTPVIPPPVTRAPPVLAEGMTYTDIDLTNMRKIIAKRLTESKISTPHAYSTIDCNITQLTALRQDFINQGTKVSVNDFIIKAAAVSLQRVPEVNAMWTDEGGSLISDIDISVAVATDAGLITPIVKDAIGLGVEQISTTIRELAGRARIGKLRANEYLGGTFTISNLGMFGISEFTAIINPPQACIMAVGTSRLELDITGTPQTYMKVTLSSDARLVNEFLASRFLETFRDVMENPMLMLSHTPKVDLEKLFAK